MKNENITKLTNLSVDKNGIINEKTVHVPNLPTSRAVVPVTPKKNMLILEPIPMSEVITKAGLVIPKEYASAFSDAAVKGVVVSVGSEVAEWQVGQVVILNSPNAGSGVMLGGKIYVFVYESEVIASYNDVFIPEKVEEPVVEETPESGLIL